MRFVDIALLVLSSLLGLFLAVFIFRYRKAPGSQALSILILGASIWADIKHGMVSLYTHYRATRVSIPARENWGGGLLIGHSLPIKESGIPRKESPGCLKDKGF